MNKILKSFGRMKIIILVFVVLLLSVIMLLFFYNKYNNNSNKPDDDLEKLDDYPSIVRELYANSINVSCYGSIMLDIGLDSGKVNVNDMNMNNLLDYMFNYMDISGKLDSEISINEIEKISNNLFNAKIDFKNKLNNYHYGDYEYIVNGNNIARNKSECIIDRQYVSQLYAYFYDNEKVSLDINIGYLIDNMLYDLQNNQLGEYDSRVDILDKMFKDSSMYRYNYKKVDGIYKLDSVEWNSKQLD